MDKRRLLLLTFAVLVAIPLLESCSRSEPGASPSEGASASPPQAPAPAPNPEPPPPPAPAGDRGGGTDIASAKPYPHVDAIFYAETPETIGEQAEVCLEVLPPNVSASSVTRADLQCKPISPAAGMSPPGAVSKDEGTPGVDTSEYMKAVLEFDSEDFEVQNPSLLMRFAAPGQHKSFEFKVVPKRIGERQLSVRLFTTDANGNAVDDIFDGRSTVHVKVGRDPVTYLDWLLDHWEALAGVGAGLVTLWVWIRKPFGSSGSRKASAASSDDGNAGSDGTG